MELTFLNDIIIIIGLSIAIFYICHKIHIPSILGFLLTGIFVGPYGCKLIKGIHEVEVFAEVGVIFLLFTIGIEFSLQKLLQIKKLVLIGGSLQVFITVFLTTVLIMKFGLTPEQGLFIGFLVALSSTAIVLKQIQVRGEVDSPSGRSILGILIFQDIIIVPMILFTPILAGVSGNPAASLIILFVKAIGIIILVLLSAKWIIPNLLYQITRTRNQEVFLLCIIVICMGVAWITSKVGLSLALGAFLAGLIISESEYSHQALGNILPFRDLFTSFFFVSIGMLFNAGFLFQMPGQILLITVCVIALKAFIAILVAILLGLPLRIAIIIGFALSQIGEFSFILSGTGLEYGLLTDNFYQIFLAVAILTMGVTPFIINLSPKIANLLSGVPLPGRLKNGSQPVKELEKIKLRDHLIIIGFGINGRNVARAIKAVKIPYVIVEMNPDTVKTEREKGEPIFYGDATSEAILHNTNLNDARVVVVAINDPSAIRRITEVVRRHNPTVHMIVRTRYLQEMKPLYELGADEVIPEEFETSIELFTRVLTRYLVPIDEIEKVVSEVRSDGYKMFRSLSRVPASFPGFHLHDVDICSYKIKEDSGLVEKSIGQINLRREYSITLVAIERDSKIIANPGADAIFQKNDILFIFGSPEKISEFTNKF